LKKFPPEKLLIVIGGSNDIGLSVINSGIENNYKVLTTYLQNKSFLQTIKRNSIDDKNVELEKLDISNHHNVKSLFKSIEKNKYENINLLNLSSLDLGRKKLEEICVSDIIKTVNINLTSAIVLTKYFEKYLQPKNKNYFNKIIHMASEAGISGGRNISSYAASKGGVITFVKAVSKELLDKNILINSISPGIILSGRNKHLNEKVKLDIEKNVPLGYLGKPIELSNIIFSLLNRDNYFNGINIRFNGGRF
jgi:3-oxoacyl-[acyl-carrier protein] reductase